MNRPLRLVARLAATLMLAAAPVAVASTAPAMASIPAGAVFALSNEADGNEVVVLHRDRDGALTQGPEYPTDGMGSGGGLGSQGALTLTDDGRYLLAVNAGSDDITAFWVRGSFLVRLNTVQSGGDMPVSVTEHRGVVYAVNAGSTPTIGGFTLNRHGLSPLPGSTQALAGAGPAQISFTPNGDHLVVTDKPRNMIHTFAVDRRGHAATPVSSPSVGMTPFGFDIDRRGHLGVSEAFGGAAGASTTSSYAVGPDGSVDAISGRSGPGKRRPAECPSPTTGATHT
ncbi:MAG: hypothetical protein ABWZ26_03650 [Candidatus Nanopelagicales bacterium]